MSVPNRLFNLKYEMAIRDLNAEDLAACLGVHLKTAHNKMSGITEFNVYEACKVITEFLKMPFNKEVFEYLFKKGVTIYGQQ